ncbi:UDP-glycosyltransferase 92A1 [Senna tora]|uniref:UDP-glycosyltransferase 92A1 n=1 Tax=Senna tora TaxID=362788 RepID=A0A834X8K7_9FABA|nr:UDP-glycosyltransferase 92A1 [Senna tora]
MSIAHERQTASLPFLPRSLLLFPFLSKTEENAKKAPSPLLADLGLAFLSLEPHLRAIISAITEQEGRPTLFIICDVFFGWVSDVAKSFSTKSICFTTCGAYETITYMSIWLNLPHQKNRLRRVLRYRLP